MCITKPGNPQKCSERIIFNWLSVKAVLFLYREAVFCREWNEMSDTYYLHAELWRQRPLSLVLDCTFSCFLISGLLDLGKKWIWNCRLNCPNLLVRVMRGLCRLPGKVGQYFATAEPVCRDCTVFSIIHFSSEPISYFNLDCSPSAQKR